MVLNCNHKRPTFNSYIKADRGYHEIPSFVYWIFNHWRQEKLGRSITPITGVMDMERSARYKVRCMNSRGGRESTQRIQTSQRRHVKFQSI